MKFLVVLCALAAYTSAKPLAGFAYSALAAPYVAPVPYAAAPVPYAAAPVPYAAAPVPYAAAPVPYAAAPVPYAAAPYPYPAASIVSAPFKSQYYAQDFAGRISYGFAEPTQAQTVIQDAAGNKVGSFSYINADGKLVQTNYVADTLGYRVASNDLPSAPQEELKPIEDTPEVAEAKAKFFADFEQAKTRNRREVTAELTPASTQKLADPAPIAPVAVPISFARSISPIPYTTQVPLAYSSPYLYPFSYSLPIVV